MTDEKLNELWENLNAAFLAGDGAAYVVAYKEWEDALDEFWRGVRQKTAR